MHAHANTHIHICVAIQTHVKKKRGKENKIGEVIQWDNGEDGIIEARQRRL